MKKTDDFLRNRESSVFSCYLITLKYLASGCANTMAVTLASGSIMKPSVSSMPISSGEIRRK